MTTPSFTYAIGIEFIGTRYRGWQRQQEVMSIQEKLESAFSKIANEPIELVAAGRTDAGVHAGNMIAHFTTHAYRDDYNWLRGVNTLLPNDIAVRWLVPMPDSFHARFKAMTRRYRYITLNQTQRPAILYRQVTHHYAPLDISAMIHASHSIVGVHDFSSFRAASCQSRQPVRTVHHANLFTHGAFLVLDIEADGVRAWNKKQAQDSLQLFVDLLKAKYGVTPIIYSYSRYYNEMLAPKFNKLHLFIAKYSKEEPVVEGVGKHNLWQHTDQGIVDGISMPVDLNVFAEGTTLEDILMPVGSQ